MSAKPNMSASTDRARAPIIRCAPISFGDARGASSIAATTAPSICGRKRSSATIRCAHRPAASLGQGRARPRLHGGARTRPAAGGRSPTRNCWRRSRHIASALLARGLSAEKPVVILSGNSIDHALIAFGALYAGIPFCPVSPAYSLVSQDYGKLGYLMKLLTPGLVFADDADEIRRCAGRQCLRLAPRSRRRAARCPAATSPRSRI